MRPMYINLGWVNNAYNNLPFFKEAISTTERETTAKVDTIANEFGRNITPIINNKTKIGGTFSRNFSINFLF